MRCLLRNIKIGNIWFTDSPLTTEEVEAMRDGRLASMRAGERAGSRQWPLFLWGFSWPGGSPGTWEPESSSESHYTDITSWPEQSADVGAGEWMILAVWGDGVLGGRAQAAWNSMIHPALQRKPVVAQRRQEMGRLGELLRRWQQNRPLLTWGQACQHLSPWGSPPESPGGASALLAQAIQRPTDRKAPSKFLAAPPWSRTIAKDKPRSKRHSDLQWLAVPAPPRGSFTQQACTTDSPTLGQSQSPRVWP